MLSVLLKSNPQFPVCMPLSFMGSGFFIYPPLVTVKKTRAHASAVGGQLLKIGSFYLEFQVGGVSEHPVRKRNW